MAPLLFSICGFHGSDLRGFPKNNNNGSLVDHWLTFGGPFVDLWFPRIHGSADPKGLQDPQICGAHRSVVPKKGSFRIRKGKVPRRKGSQEVFINRLIHRLLIN